MITTVPGSARPLMGDTIMLQTQTQGNYGKCNSLIRIKENIKYYYVNQDLLSFYFQIGKR